MKSLDLNSYGVQEMNVQEMKVVEGGKFPPLGWWLRMGSTGISFAMAAYSCRYEKF